MPEKELIDIAVIVPLAEEVREFLEVFPSIENRTEGIRLQHLVDTGASKLKMLVVLQDAMGRTSAAHTATSVLSSFRVKLIICLGIAGGLHKDVQICDVCYTGQIYDVYDNTKTSDANDGGVTIDFSPVGYRTPQLITATLNFVRSQPDQIGRYEEWQRDRERYATDLIASTGNGDEACSKTIGRPTTLNGAMVCGSVSSSQNYNTQLKGVDRKLLAIETEVGGICSVADVLGVPVLAIRGISDLADKGKGELEAKTKGVIRTIAASNAASFLRLQLGNPYFIQAVHGLGEATQTRMDLNSPDDTNLLPSNILTTIHQDVDINLRELAPEMRVQPAGYQLPPPRAQRRQGLKLQADEDSNQPREVKELIVRIPMHRGHLLRFDRGQATDLIAATIPI